jgi:hypothetical protein
VRVSSRASSIKDASETLIFDFNSTGEEYGDVIAQRDKARAIWPNWPHGLNKRMAPEDLVDIEQEGEMSEEQLAEALKLSIGTAKSLDLPDTPR